LGKDFFHPWSTPPFFCPLPRVCFRGARTALFMPGVGQSRVLWAPGTPRGSSPVLLFFFFFVAKTCLIWVWGARPIQKPTFFCPPPLRPALFGVRATGFCFWLGWSFLPGPTAKRGPRIVKNPSPLGVGFSFFFLRKNCVVFFCFFFRKNARRWDSYINQMSRPPLDKRCGAISPRPPPRA